ncbi:NAD(P)-dependent dehydrogenase (short-subunit alcohol dehydrogenase family) [Litorivivens lipolytica]|uniref:NAD(P)-dependent dehydrogenase (Short-subunit alcohol dehydrogenase family) n=1 Tax=Litorivivens lipolytica TaxID=1524264 RepID=A0A7W4W5R4_9GAMM|nr:SDR family NAD(P)-dependent oxidoreductase [Litorivivens lipolytica]MBB3047978.1 NAD(P)-dependent dehydrogenase (short-subunit alcohol dehydrogenase family) [Litorivivens lipolytica]
MRLQGKVAIVTGAASGIGLACAERFAQEGAIVVGTDLNEPKDWSLVTSASPESWFSTLDVTDGDAQNAVAKQTAEKHGRIDILVTAAGVGDGGPVSMIDNAAWDRVIDINLKGTFLSIKSVLDTMMAQRSGSIITVSSVEGINGTEGGSAYNASKGGVILLTKNVSIDYGRMGIRSNAICPGFIDTPMLHGIMDSMPEFKADVIRETKVGRLGKPEEIAGAALFLASDDASFVTGQSLAVDGGYTAGHRHGIVELMGLV